MHGHGLAILIVFRGIGHWYMFSVESNTNYSRNRLPVFRYFDL